MRAGACDMRITDDDVIAVMMMVMMANGVVLGTVYLCFRPVLPHTAIHVMRVVGVPIDDAPAHFFPAFSAHHDVLSGFVDDAPHQQI